MTEAAYDVITLGESMVVFGADNCGPLSDVSAFTKRLAGAETNVAIGLARMGLRTAWVSRLGADSFGEFILRSVAAEGVDCSGVRIDPLRGTGFMLKSRTDDGSDPVVEYHRRGSAASLLCMADFEEERFLAARHLHITGISPALSAGTSELVEHAMKFMRAHGRSISFDPNLRPSLWPNTRYMIERVNHFAGLADWVLPGLAEGRLLTGCDAPNSIANWYLDHGASLVAVKLGAAGASYATRVEQGRVHGIAVAKVVDTVGAGDGFAAGVVSARLQGLGWADAVARGNALGASVVQAEGDMPYPNQLPS